MLMIIIERILLTQTEMALFFCVDLRYIVWSPLSQEICLCSLELAKIIVINASNHTYLYFTSEDHSEVSVDDIRAPVYRLYLYHMMSDYSCKYDTYLNVSILR